MEADITYWNVLIPQILEDVGNYSYLSLNYFATFWIVLKYDWFNKDLGVAFPKNVAWYIIGTILTPILL